MTDMDQAWKYLRFVWVRSAEPPLVAILLLGFVHFVHGEAECGGCHAEFAAGHGGQRIECSACHLGRSDAVAIEQGHEGLIVRPGEMSNAAKTCGGCHAPQWAGVRTSPMHTGRGMVEVTRRAFGEHAATEASLQSLSDSPADSLLSKLCASCHLGQEGGSIDPTSHDPISRRGGGCLACHLDPAMAGDDRSGHTRLSRRIDDARCLGCHSRSARISLNYAGLAEVDPPTAERAWRRLSRLADGRLVEHKSADIHHRAGMSCVDCHTGVGLMGQVRTVDIACRDCHANQRSRLRSEHLTPVLRRLRERLGIDTGEETMMLQTAHGTPLWHLEVSQDEVWLHPKSGRARLRVPQATTDHFASAENHRHLACAACHATWAPQCYGCHLDFDPNAVQWDHARQRPTAGLWRERRWLVRNDRPPLGVDARGEVRPVVPGMIMSIDFLGRKESLFVRRFAAIAPHTNGRSRSCNDCHGSPRAMGLGDGVLERHTGGLDFHPALRALADGLPADAWTDLSRASGGSTEGEIRPFSRERMQRLLAPID